jgi:hypothetical protein
MHDEFSLIFDIYENVSSTQTSSRDLDHELIDEILMELSYRLHDQSRLTSFNLQTSIK